MIPLVVAVGKILLPEASHDYYRHIADGCKPRSTRLGLSRHNAV
jgi:hypothetical protein